jgi:hypothetical protein
MRRGALLGAVSLLLAFLVPDRVAAGAEYQ